MNTLSLVLFLTGAAIGAVAVFILARRYYTQLIAGEKQEHADVEDRYAAVCVERDAERERRITAETLLDAERTSAAAREELIRRSEETLRESFKSLSAETLEQNIKQFLTLATQEFEKHKVEARGDADKRVQAVDALVKPIQDKLREYDDHLKTVKSLLDKEYGALSEQVRSQHETEEGLKREVTRFADALSRYRIRGRWGEIQLRRIIEIAGMQENCDFDTQESVTTGEGARLRPDLIVNFPGGMRIAVDAKAPMDAYRAALECSDEEGRKKNMEAHAQAVRTHIRQLSAKAYWRQFEGSPEFVIMFIPGEPVYLAALDQDGSLLDEGIQKGVILASPTSLIALLRVAALGWRQEQLAANAAKISDLGRELYERIAVVAGHLDKLGRHIDGSAKAYNELLSSIESRVLVSARRFEALGVHGKKEIESPDQVDTAVRGLSAPEMLGE